MPEKHNIEPSKSSSVGKQYNLCVQTDLQSLYLHVMVLSKPRQEHSALSLQLPLPSRVCKQSKHVLVQKRLLIGQVLVLAYRYTKMWLSTK